MASIVYKTKEIGQSASIVLNYVRAQLLSDPQARINGNVVRIVNRIVSGKRSLLLLLPADLDERNYRKISKALVEAVIRRPRLLVGKKSALHPHVAALKKLYSLYRNGTPAVTKRVAKAVFARGDPFNTGNALQGLLDFYDNNAALIEQVMRYHNHSP